MSIDRLEALIDGLEALATVDRHDASIDDGLDAPANVDRHDASIGGLEALTDVDRLEAPIDGLEALGAPATKNVPFFLKIRKLYFGRV